MSEKKQTFLHGAMLLAISTAVVKVIGALYKLPLNMVIGPKGFGYFNTAYEIYAVLLIISTAGLPVAMSRMISEANALGHYNRVRKIYAVSRALFFGIGTLSALFMMLGCKALAKSMSQPDAWTAILCLGPCALFICMMSTYRGFFQGQENMRPTSVSQVIEAVVKLAVGLVAALVVLKLTNDIALAAGGAILGVTVSCVVSVIYLRKKLGPEYRQLPVTEEKAESFATTAKKLLTIAVPITIGSAGLSLLNVLEIGLYMDRLVYLVESNQYMGHMVSLENSAQDVADTIKGVYNMGQTIFNMPPSLIMPITISVVPAITAQLTLKNTAAVKSTEESAARVTGLLSLPCAVGLSVLAKPILAVLGGYEGELLDIGAACLSVMGLNVFLYSTTQYTTAVLQAHGKAHLPVVNMLLCGMLKLVTVYVLVGNPAIGIMGAPIGAAICYGSIAVLNFGIIAKVVPQKPALLKNLLRPVLPAAIMGGAVYGVYLGISRFTQSDLLLCAIPVAVGALLYVVFAVIFKAVTVEDCQLLPKGDKLAKFLKL